MRTRSSRKLVAAATGAVLVAGAGACAADAGGEDDTFDIVAAFYPLQFAAEQVAGSAASVTGLAPPGVEAHDLELTPSQVADVNDADLVVYLREFQPAVDEAVDEHVADRAFDVAQAVPLLEEGGDAAHEEHEEHEGHDHGEHEGHQHGAEDPHLWLDPVRFATVAQELADRLAAQDPDHAPEYEAGAAELRGTLQELDTAYAEGLADCERREIVVSHAAFGYLADRYDLRQIPVTGLAPEEEPSPQQLADVVHRAREVGATTIFFEVLVNPDVAEVIASEVGARTAALDPVEGLPPESADEEDYLSIMQANLDTLRTALGCA